jgi:hypothetical protein
MLPPMEINFEKVWINGKKMYKYVGHTNVLGIYDVPFVYRLGYPVIRENSFDKTGIVYQFEDDYERYLYVGDTFTEDQLLEFEHGAILAGSRLGLMRKAEKEAWKGTITMKV